jgi:uncharacterized protein YecE (DUF72 family)
VDFEMRVGVRDEILAAVSQGLIAFGETSRRNDDSFFRWQSFQLTASSPAIAAIRTGTADAMITTADVRIGTAGWSIPRAAAFRFESAGTHLERYSRLLRCAEINSSFHRPHAAATYAKWRDSMPADFRFAVKMPRTITHELKLRDARVPFVAFMEQTDGLGEKRGPILVQLPPSLSFEASVVSRFLDMVRREYNGPMACEPRHASWFSSAVASLLDGYGLSRVAADPPVVPEATVPAGWPRLAYFRLHGSPRKYWSRYDEDRIATLAATVRSAATAGEVWCVFDNTASGAAIENAWELRERLIVDRPGG